MRRRSGKDLDMCGGVEAAVWSERVEVESNTPSNYTEKPPININL